MAPPDRPRTTRRARPLGERHGRPQSRCQGSGPCGSGPAAAILRDVTSVGRRALAETGQLLRLVRGDDELGLHPDPGLDRLDDLIAGARRGGLDVDLTVEGSLGGLSPTTDLSAYRIVQEALTNAGRYGCGSVSVRLVRTPQAVEIIAENPMGTAESSGAASA